MTLPVLNAESCRTCGACCTDVGVPPYRVAELFGLPARLRAWLLRRLAAIKGDPRGGPCFAYRAGRCRIYRWRPAVCRDFVIGGAACLRYRVRSGVAA